MDEKGRVTIVYYLTFTGRTEENNVKFTDEQVGSCYLRRSLYRRLAQNLADRRLSMTADH